MTTPTVAMEQLQLLLTLIICSLVDHPALLSIGMHETDGTVLFRVRAANEDIGRIIGSQGRTVRSIRTCLLAAATKKGLRCTLEVIENRLDRHTDVHSDTPEFAAAQQS